MNVSGEGRGCDETTGFFMVQELTRAPEGYVTSLAINFIQHCDGWTRRLVGGVRFNSGISFYQWFDEGVSCCAWMSLTGIAGDTRDLRFGPYEGNFRVLPTPDGGVDFVYQSVPPGSSWHVSLGNVAGQPLREGRYEGAMRFPFQDANHPGIDVSGDGVGCNTATGRFIVYELSRDYDGVMLTYSADFEYHCDGAQSALAGSIRYHSWLSNFGPLPPPTLTIDPVSTLVTAGSEFYVTVVARWAPPNNNILMARVPVTLQFDCKPGGACAASRESEVLTDAAGRAVFSVVANGGVGSYSLTAHYLNSSATAEIAQRKVVDEYQDMWWGGPDENGWGMSIVQHDDKLFSVIYAYDAGGSSTWFVMPAGTWDETNTIYSGQLYIPHGAPYFAYDTGRFGSGSPVGNMRITFVDGNHATLEYTINGQSGVKDIARQLFGPPSSQSVAQRGDMWWGGASENGWGIAVLQQFSSLFSVWFTYDAGGSPTWFVLPSGTWTASDTYEGRVYRTMGSPWIGAGYNASQLQATDVGSFSLRFSGINATFDYNVESHAGSLSLERQPF